MLKVYSTDIVMQEIPGEISLALAISNCPYKCQYCHTPQLQEDVGDPYTEIIDKLLLQYGDAITTVLFLGGDAALEELRDAAAVLKNLTKLKTAVYLGRREIPEGFKEVFDYIKVGPYIHRRGGLSSPATNQRLYKVVGGELEDMTSSFWRNYEN